MTRAATDTPASLTSAYRPLDGVADEMAAPDGTVRELWRAFMARVDELGPAGLATRAERADRYLNDAGVYYRFYQREESQTRTYPLAHLPLIIDGAEWESLSEGLSQRADLLEQVVADIYGANRLVEQNLLPPGLIAGSPEYLRPLAGVTPAGGHFLHLVAFELGRGPDGHWWVLGDRTQAPSGLGFALETRVATTKAFPAIQQDMAVRTLADFYTGFRDALGAMAGADDTVGLLTPGALNETYFEQAYIARHLGMALLEGEDLTVSNGRVMVRTVTGLKPVSVLWRRLDAGFADPLELNTASRIGTPGLVEAVRAQNIRMVNALGSGVLEMRALLAFLPRICEALSGSPLKLPSIATWWCGQDSERAHVLDRFDSMMIGPAQSARLPFEDEEDTIHGGGLDAETAAAWRKRIERSGDHFVGQESVSLSTTPVFVDGKLEPRPVTLRVFLVRTASGWRAMPGGLARIGLTLEPSAIAMQRGGHAADVWVTGTPGGPEHAPAATAKPPYERPPTDTLPSRAAENLTWLGRYTERTESLARVLRAWHVRLAETGHGESQLLQLVRAHLTSWGVDVMRPVAPLADSIDRAIISAGNVRSHFSSDGWLALRDLGKTLDGFTGRIEPGDDATSAMTVALRKLAGFNGLLHENMYRFTGWHFLEIGRRMERATQLSRALSLLASDATPEGAWDMMLEIADSTLTHRRQYTAQFGRLTIVDILTLDERNPRSLIFQIERLKEEIDGLPRGDGGHDHQRLERAALKLHSGLAVAEPTLITPKSLAELEDDLAALYDMLAEACF